MNSQTSSTTLPDKAPLQICWRNFEGTEELVAGVEAELERIEALCAINRCQVTVEAVLKETYQATVLLELGGFWRLSRCRASDALGAVREAFSNARAHLARGGMRQSVDLWGMLGPLAAHGRAALGT